MRALRNGLNILDPETLTRLTPSDLDAYYRDEATAAPRSSTSRVDSPSIRRSAPYCGSDTMVTF